MVGFGSPPRLQFRSLYGIRFQLRNDIRHSEVGREQAISGHRELVVFADYNSMNER